MLEDQNDEVLGNIADYFELLRDFLKRQNIIVSIDVSKPTTGRSILCIQCRSILVSYYICRLLTIPPK